MPEKKELPAFEVHEKSGKIYKVYQDGTVEGFEDDALVVNRLPIRFVDKTAKPSAEIRRIKGGAVKAPLTGYSEPK